MDKINWTVSIVVGAILTIPFGIIANLLTRRVEIWLSKKAITFRSKSMKRIQKEYARVKRYHESPLQLQLLTNQFLIISFLVIMIFLITISFGIITYIAPTSHFEVKVSVFKTMTWINIFMIDLILFLLIHIGNLTKRVMDFDEYEKSVFEQFRKLERLSEKKPE